MSMYTIRLKDLSVSCVLGVFDWEKQAPRQVLLTIRLEVAAPHAARTDAMADSVDYSAVESAVIHHARSRPFQLIETLVHELCSVLLALDGRIQLVEVEADKPGALRQARSVSVSATLTRSE